MTGLIVAYDKNRLIGKDGKMPWYIPGELKRFRQLTENNVVIMGRKTFEGLNGPLPNRINIILTRKKDYSADGCYVADSIENAIDMCHKLWPEKDIFIGGGAQIYKQAIDLVDTLFITEIDGEFEGDTYFPDFDKSLYTKVIEGKYESTVPYTYITYTKK